MNKDLHDQVAYWHAAQDGEDMDWEGFTAWLEADPRNRPAFNEILLLDDDIVAQRDVIATRLERDEPQESRRRWPWALVCGGVIAASLALFLAVPGPVDVVWQTTSASRVIALSDGTRATLAPQSHMVALGGNQAKLSLTGGAYFEVPHRSGRTLTISAGGYAITDIGTRFDVTTDQVATRVNVAQGEVSVSSSVLDRAIPLGAGHGIIARDGAITLVNESLSSVGSWRNGTLSYREIPLALVAADIARYSGDEVTIDPAIADRRFLGTLTIGDGSKLATAVAEIMRLDVRRVGHRVRLEPRR